LNCYALTPENVKAQIERQKTKYGWGLIFLGENIEAVKTASRFGIAPDRAQNYHADSEGAAMPEGWNDEIQKDYKRRGGRK